MDDAELVRATRAGDRSAFIAIFDRHAARVHDLALAMLRDRSGALEVVEATFLEASLRVHGLEEEHRLPVWLLAVTRRNGALRAGPAAGVDRQPSLPNDDPERVHLAGLVWEAVADLPLRDRTLLDLDLRHGLDGHDLADALGVTLTQSQELQARMRDRIEKGLSGYLIARTSDGRCPGLTKVLKGWDGRFTPKESLRIADHVDGCTVCNQTRFALPSPFALYAAALPAPFPAVVRPRVIERMVLPVGAGGATGMPASPAFSGLGEEPTAAYQSPMPATSGPQSAVAASAYQPATSPFQDPSPAPYPEVPPSPSPYPEAAPPPPYPEIPAPTPQPEVPSPAPYPEVPAPPPYPEAPPSAPYPETSPPPPPFPDAPPPPPYPEAPLSQGSTAEVPPSPALHAEPPSPATPPEPPVAATDAQPPTPASSSEPVLGLPPYPEDPSPTLYSESPASHPDGAAPEAREPEPQPGAVPVPAYDPYPPSAPGADPSPWPEAAPGPIPDEEAPLAPSGSAVEADGASTAPPGPTPADDGREPAPKPADPPPSPLRP